MINAALLSAVLSAIAVGFFAALKYYSNTLGPNPESFDYNKFIPIFVLSVAVSIGMVLGTGNAITSDQVNNFLTLNFMLVLFANTGWTILVKKYPSLGQLFSPPP